MSSKSYAGSLTSKRKADLVEIAEALKLPAAEGKIGDLIKNIQAHLDKNETALKESPMFKGLYKGRRSHTETDGEASPDLVGIASTTLMSAAKKSRKSINKAFERVQEVIDATNVPLPESPVSRAKIQEVTDVTVSRDLIPAQNISHDLTTRFHHVSGQVAKLGRAQIARYEVAVRHIREYLSSPAHILTAALSLEFLSLLIHVTQWYNHTIFFPPSASDKETIASLLHALFFWAPSVTYTVRVPEFRSAFHGHVWGAVSWWFVCTVLPALAASSLISFVPQKSTHRASTRHVPTHPASSHSAHGSTPTIDPLSFSLFRGAILLLPLTSAAPGSMVDALEMSGNPQGRALAAGLTVALMLADRLHA